VRIQVRLVDPRFNRPIWSDRFDRPLRDIALVRSEIASTIADALTVRLVPSGAEPPSNFAAYELYLRGLFHWHRRSPQDISRAIDFFQQATHHDSTFAQPWAGLALAYAVLPALDGSSNELLQRAEQAAARALVLDSTLADAWAARGYAMHWQWRWIDAEQSFQRAIALSPTHSTAHQWYGEHLAKMGRTAEGERMVRRAIELDPLALVAQNDLGIVLMFDRRFDEAIAQLQRVSRADPGFGPALLLQHRIHVLLGDTGAAAETGRRAAELIRIFDPAEIALISRATRDPALREQAIAILKGWERQSSPRWPDIAMYFTLLGENRLAIDALEQAMRARSPHLAQLRAAPWMDPLRNEPRVQEIMRRLAFP
jgi:serine/threonine-protein kinase